MKHNSSLIYQSVVYCIWIEVTHQKTDSFNVAVLLK